MYCSEWLSITYLNIPLASFQEKKKLNDSFESKATCFKIINSLPYIFVNMAKKKTYSSTKIQ